MKKRYSRGIVVVSLLLIYGFSTAQELGGSGGSGMSNQKSIKDSVKTNIAGQLSFKGAPIAIDMGSPEIGNDEGIFIWLDERKTWQIRWQGEPGKFVWLRVTTENLFSDVATIGDGVKVEISGKTGLIVTGTTKSDKAGLSFKCETFWISVDAKWNMLRDNTKLNISAQKMKPASLPTEIMASVYKNIVSSVGRISQEKSLSNAPTANGGGGSGGAK